MKVRAVRVVGVFVLGSTITAFGQGLSGADVQSLRTKTPLTDRSRLPPALQKVRLDRLSSGALMLLDRDGDLVEWPAALAPLAPESAPSPYAAAAAAIALDPRVGANIRLGNDPAALPPAMRAQAEPHIARALNNSDLLLATFQEGRFTTAGAVDCGFSVSHDGGFSWSRALIPRLTQTSGGPYFRATDPVAGSDANGNLYLCTLAATDANFGSGVVVVSRSTNDGATFAAPRVAYQTPNNTLFPDKNWMAINTFPGTPTFGRIVVTFTLFSDTSTEGAPIMRAYSDDGGITWSAAAFIHSANTNAQGSQPVFLPDGKLAIVYWNFGSPNSPGERLEVVLSNNGGTTFSPPKRIADAIEFSPPNIRSGVFLPSAVADRTNGNLYVVYQALSDGAPRILFTKSTNAGTTWSAPAPISNNIANTAVFNPAIATSPDGKTLTVAFYDNRANPGQSTLVDMFLALSSNGGANWEPNIRLTSVSTNAGLAPLTAAGYMLGDYLGIAESTRPDVPTVPVWIDTRTGNPDPFIARVQAVAAIKGDFNGDRKADILWQNTANGDALILLMNGTAPGGIVNLPKVGAEWQIAGTGDFNGDGKADILGQNSATGERLIVLMNGTAPKAIVNLPSAAVEWQIAGAGDFNGDAKADILWQNSVTGERLILFMNGTAPSGVVNLPNAAIELRIAGAGDFNGDGQADILWQNSGTGERFISQMNGTTPGDAVVLPNAALEWQIAGAGDFNGDGKADILWQNTATGERLILLMSGTTPSGVVSLGLVSTEWEIRNR